MWEYRLVWSRGKPGAWDAAWQRGLEVLAAEGRQVEERPDTYLVLKGRADAGLKLRGGDEDDFDVKVRHARSGGWELWEKCVFLKWNALEAVRLAAMLQLAPPPAGRVVKGSPSRSAEALLAAAGIEHTRVEVRKSRMQGAARDVVFGWTGSSLSPGWLAELVEIALPGRSGPVFSLCLEALAPPAGAGDPIPPDGARRSGYPELLLEFLADAI